MLKHLVILLVLLQLSNCLSIRSNIWWSRRDDNSERECVPPYEDENPSLEGKICGYCFAKCQQQFAACLLAQIHQVVSGSLDYCDHMSKTCEKNCFNDKRTSRIAETNWDKVAKILQQFNSYSSPDDTEKH